MEIRVGFVQQFGLDFKIEKLKRSGLGIGSRHMEPENTRIESKVEPLAHYIIFLATLIPKMKRTQPVLDSLRPPFQFRPRA